MENLWDSRFKAKEYVYGTLPNVFFKTTIDKYNLKGKILLPAEGEGRNAVYAAQKGMDVYAFDTSIEGKNKAMKLAELNAGDICNKQKVLFTKDAFMALLDKKKTN